MINHKKTTNNTKAYVTLLGCVCQMMVNGSSYFTGSITPYVAIYFGVSFSDVSILVPAQVVASTLSVTLGSQLLGRISPAYHVALANLIVMAALLTSSFLRGSDEVICFDEPTGESTATAAFWTFVIVYCSGFGLVNGLSYMVPVHYGFQTFPDSPGLISGLVISGYGIGQLVFTSLAYKMVNPDNLPISAEYEAQLKASIDVNFPRMLQLLSMTLGCFALLISILFKVGTKGIELDLEKEKEKAAKGQNQLSIKQCIFSVPFFSLYLIGITSIFLGYYVLSVYKLFGLSMGGEIANDSFLTQVGIVTSIAGAARMIWSSLLDFKWASFKLIFGILLCLQIVLASTMMWAAQQGRTTFMIWISLIIFAEGGHFTLLPNAFRTVFGKELASRVYGFAFTFTGVSSIIMILILKNVTENSYAFMFKLSAGLCVFALIILVCVFSEKPYNETKQQDNFERVDDEELDLKFKLPIDSDSFSSTKESLKYVVVK